MTVILEEVLDDKGDETQERVRTWEFGVVTRVDPDKRQVDVQPLTKQRSYGEPDEPSDKLKGQVLNVPIFYPGSDDFDMAFTVKVSSMVLLLYGMESVDDILDQLAPDFVGPYEYEKHGESDAIAIAGIRSFARPGLPMPQNGLEIRASAQSAGAVEHCYKMDGDTGDTQISAPGQLILQGGTGIVLDTIPGSCIINGREDDITDGAY